MTGDRDHLAQLRHEHVQLALLIAVAALLGTAAFAVSTLWHRIVDQLINHHLIVPAARHPTVTLPHAHGAGLDEIRLAALAFAVLVLAAAAVLGIHLWHRHRDLAGPGR